MPTSNKHVREWPTILAGDEILATAILDRLLHHVRVLSIDGRAYRLASSTRYWVRALMSCALHLAEGPHSKP